MAPPETREHGRKRFDATRYLAYAVWVASGVVVRGGDPRLTLGVRLTLENHRKSLDLYTRDGRLIGVQW